ncbi:MAG: hypothetical protein L3J37_03230 [Rhodobacteraceae bacterium]|nr:hypothetical protein [Paracoccaceae bacterium]
MKIISIALAVIFAAAPAFSQNIISRDGGPGRSEMIARNGDVDIDGLAFVRPVLSGVLYRGGFQGGDKGRTGLSNAQRIDLCNTGFSQARYIDYGKNTNYGEIDCPTGSFNYEGGRSTSTSELMQTIYNVIKNPSEGPVYVHCMWGVHSSGAVAAMALVQFCGWSERSAKKYWDEARNGAPCSGGCDDWIDGRFERFSVDPALTISATEQAAICPTEF